MNQKKKIAIIGFANYENFGDQFIVKCVEYLVKKHGYEEVKILDFCIEKQSKVKFQCLRFSCKLARELKMKRISSLLCIQKYRENYKNGLFRELKDVKAIIFAGGSFKYGTQDVWIQYSCIIEYAREHNIAVMFNAMNVQTYNEKDFRCKYLKDHLNFSCVKMFTSRDGVPGVQRLKKYYVENAELKVYAVADPAYWIPETYNINKKEKSKEKRIIGINIIAPDRFRLYGGFLSPEEVKMSYRNFFRLLDDANVKWEIFTNGMRDDIQFALELLKEEKLDKEKLITPNSDIELANIISNYYAVFAGRLHAAICAYSLKIPVAGFTWDEKILRFAEMANIKKAFLNETEISEQNMFEALRCAINEQSNSDDDAREKWRELTQKSIFEFLDSVEIFEVKN